ncbi:unnamed protein product [Gongylonema pulchrum]|uniref:Exocyst complex component Sec8 n=1 Tax=Gongylonema pulchrum TaxID=637853 RepID=A0A183EUI9_9BILA|nr:unnamed protein product [Gongylonema pulchrum]
MDDELNKVNQSELADDDEVLPLSVDFWETAQAVVENLIGEYIAEDGSTPNSVMQKPSTALAEKTILFRFEASACATQSGQAVKQIQSLICPPSPWNITVIYPQLEGFCSELENDVHVKNPCRLRSFLHSFIINVFIDQFKCKLEGLAEQAISDQDAWRVLVHYPNPVSFLFRPFSFIFSFFAFF